MKKLIGLLVTLGLLCAGIALADTQITTGVETGQTTIIYTVPEPETQYTVTIPSSVSIPQGETSATMLISIGEDSTLETGETLSVTLDTSTNSFNLQQTEGSDSIAYTVNKDSQPLSAGDTVLSWTEGEAIPGAATLTLTLTEPIDGKPAGEYSDTLTFRVGVAS